MPAADPPRFIDLRIDWLLQYAPETSLFGPEARERAARDLPRIEGYLGSTAMAVLAIGRDPEDWARRSDPWRALDDLIARAEAEFSGRLLIGPDDLSRWRDDPHGLTWGLLEITGLESLITTDADLERLPALFERGVRVFQTGALSVERVRSLLGVLLSLDGGPRPSIDLAGMSREVMDETLDWFEAEPERARRVIPFRSHGPIDDEAKRLRALGGFAGLGVSSRSFDSAEALRLAIDALGDGVGLATDAFGGGEPLSGVETVPDLQGWAIKAFGIDRARAILRGNAEAWVAAIMGSE